MRRIKIAGSIVLLIILVMPFNFYLKRLDEEKARTVAVTVDEIIEVGVTNSIVTLDKVKKLQEYYDNTDIKAIISIEGNDSFSYPVVQSEDNDYYLKHDYYKQYNTYGSIYADYRSNLDNGRKVLIFGHSSSKRDVPFNSLENYYDEDYYKEHRYITLETENKMIRYEIFSVYVETKDFTYMNMNFDNEEWYLHIKALQNKSLYKTDISLNKDDDILIIQTCSKKAEYQKYSKKYLLIVSRRDR